MHSLPIIILVHFLFPFIACKYAIAITVDAIKVYNGDLMNFLIKCRSVKQLKETKSL